MRYKVNVVAQLEHMTSMLSRLQFLVNRNYNQEQILENIEMLKEQVENVREMVALEDDNFPKQFGGL